MDTLLNIRAFIAAAEAGSLAGAARRLCVSPSVITKRIARLEDEMRATLFIRTTRKLEITAIGAEYLPRYRGIVNEIDEALRGARQSGGVLQGTLRIKSPTTITLLYLGRFFSDFQARHPNVNIDLVLMDRSANPNEEGFDIAIGAMPTSYANVIDIPLCVNERVLCASPTYLSEREKILHPQDLIHHDCLVLPTIGNSWTFKGEAGDIEVTVRSRFSVNDAQMLHDAACAGRGVTVVSEYIARRSIQEGRLTALLPDYPPKSLWLRAMVPRSRMDRSIVSAFIDDLKTYTSPIAPWDHPGM